MTASKKLSEKKTALTSLLVVVAEYQREIKELEGIVPKKPKYDSSAIMARERQLSMKKFTKSA